MFNVGDRVQVIKSNCGFYNHELDIGLIGNIVSTHEKNCLVEFDEEADWLHNDRRFKENRYRYYKRSEIMLVDDNIDEWTTDEIEILLR